MRPLCAASVWDIHNKKEVKTILIIGVLYMALMSRKLATLVSYTVHSLALSRLGLFSIPSVICSLSYIPTNLAIPISK